MYITLISNQLKKIGRHLAITSEEYYKTRTLQ